MPMNKSHLYTLMFLVLSFSTNASAETITLLLQSNASSGEPGPVTTLISPDQANYVIEPSIGANKKTTKINIACSFFGAIVHKL